MLAYTKMLFYLRVCISALLINFNSKLATKLLFCLVAVARLFNLARSLFKLSLLTRR